VNRGLGDLDKLLPAFGCGVAWEFMWSFRRIYAAPDLVGDQRRLRSWYADVEESGLRPFAVASVMIFKWEDEVLAHVNSCLTNAYAEGATNKTKVIKRTGSGFRNFATFAGVLVACGGCDAQKRERGVVDPTGLQRTAKSTCQTPTRRSVAE
jgi:hypothetical protein